MPQRKRKKRRTATSTDHSRRVEGLIFILLGVLGLLKLGHLGRLFDNLLRIVSGDFYQVLAVLVVLLGGYLLLNDRDPHLSRRTWWASSLIVVGSLLFKEAYFFQQLDLHANFISINWQYLIQDIIADTLGNSVGGGMVAAFLYTGTHFLVAQLGSFIIASLLIILGVLTAFNISSRQALEVVGRFLAQVFRWSGKWASRGGQKSKEVFHNFKQQADKRRKEKAPEKIQADPQKPDVQPPTTTVPKEKVVNDSKPEKQTSVWNQVQPPKSGEANHEDQKQTEPMLQQRYRTPLTDYQLPPLSLLQDGTTVDQSAEKQVIKRNERILKETFESFGVDVELKNTILGPSVTKYELHPAIGVKVSKIVNLTNDLALALAAKDIRIEAPIPGKALIGIEVPNQKVAPVAFKDVISEEQKMSHQPLEVPIGRDIAGKLITADLAKMPHLLIAGSTGSGKSVAINDIITSLLINNLPTEVKLVLVDPKKVELGIYNDIPHLLTPVVTEPQKAAKALHKLVKVMEDRYEQFANTGQRKIETYNEMIMRQNQEQGTAEPLMPYIVCVLDELSDLMMVAASEVEAAIIRIAQMGRAAGIHLILATQRPSVDVITGLIKANVPSRMAFAVSSNTDSRTIIDQSGAEKLLGRGDMLYLPMGQNKPTRVQGAFVTDDDVKNVVDFIKKQAQADYDETLLVTDNELADENEAEERDVLFDEVVTFIQQQQKCSISLLQRRFKIGYNRAARIVDQLEAAGLIGPADGSKPRQVYVKPDQNE